MRKSFSMVVIKTVLCLSALPVSWPSRGSPSSQSQLFGFSGNSFFSSVSRPEVVQLQLRGRCTDVRKNLELPSNDLQERVGLIRGLIRGGLQKLFLASAIFFLYRTSEREKMFAFESNCRMSDFRKSLKD